MTVRSGEFVSQYIDDGTVPEDAIQPNGVDLQVGTIYSLQGDGHIGTDDYDKPNRIEVPRFDGSDGECYKLTPGSYVVVYAEKIAIPENHIGEVRPRSRIMRSGGNIISAYWDAGYEGRGEGLLQLSNTLTVDCDARIAQMAFKQTEELAQTYDGTHQGERIDD